MARTKKGTPKRWEVIAQDIERRIASGEFKSGDTLPHGLELNAHYKNMPALCDARKHLIEKGVLKRTSINRCPAIKVV